MHYSAIAAGFTAVHRQDDKLQAITQSYLSICESLLSLLDATQTRNEIKSEVGEISVLDLMPVGLCVFKLSVSFL